jgi:serine/threonine protein kinase
MTRDNNTIYRLNTLFAPLLILLLLLWSVETVDAAYEQRQDKYLLLDQLGTGTFGTVHRVQDRSTREILAMKISQDHQRAVDEAKHESEILRALGGHTGVIELRDEFPCFVGKYCLVLELMSCDLMVIMTEIKQLKWEERLIAVRK